MRSDFKLIVSRALVAGVSALGAGCMDSSNPGGVSANVTSACAASMVPQSPVAMAPAFPNLQFVRPLALMQAPGDISRWFLVERGGRVLVFPNNDAAVEADVAVFVDISAGVESAIGEAGLLGMAFHPDFPVDPRVFLSDTRPDTPLVSVISSFVTNDGGLTLDPASEQEILTLAQPSEFHNGGNIAFGPDGYFYIGLGDGVAGADPEGNAQNPNILLGKMLRIDVNAGAPYAIPPDNPFAGGGALPEIYASGLRNPWRWSFDRTTGQLWLGDVGEDDWEEINLIVSGGNYGWNIREGAHCFGGGTDCPTAGLIDPVAEYGHDAGRCSVTGGYVYRGSAIPALFGSYVFGDFCTGEIWSMSTGGGPMQLIASSGLLLSSFGEGNDGEIYAVGLREGCVLRLAPGT
jgi:glucose/arabinose dehydrogenase